MLEIGFGHKIPKLNFVSHLKISQENCREKILWSNMPKKVEKSGKTLISCLMGKIPYFRVFTLFLVCLVIKIFPTFLYFDPAVVFVTSQTLLLRLALAILWFVIFSSLLLLSSKDLENDFKRYGSMDMLYSKILI